MNATVILVVLALALVLAVVFLAKRWGGTKERAKTAEASAKKSEAMLEAEANAPRTKDEVVDRLRSGRF